MERWRLMLAIGAPTDELKITDGPFFGMPTGVLVDFRALKR